jgi:protein tyrosine phosphatase (PTP) superfamily phosphohydrolase (DUF442 family)
MLSDIINYHEINPYLGTAGLPSLEQFADIQAAGYQVVISLLPHSLSNATAEEPSLVTSLGMEYINIPVVWDYPTAANLEAYFQALQTNRNRKVFVHCELNFRASAFTFLYRVLVEKTPVEVAEVSMREIWEPYDVWPAFIDGQLKQGMDNS